MDINIIKSEINTNILGQTIEVYDIIDSTQSELKRRNNIANGTIIIAEEQSSGKGTHGRVWYSDSKNKNIAMSFVLFPNCNIKKLKNITMTIAECIIETFAKLYDVKLEIKVPNDIVINSKKIGGILTETRLQGERVVRLYVGIGINVLQEKFNDNIKQIASSIYNEFNIKCSREKVIAKFLNIFEARYLKMMED